MELNKEEEIIFQIKIKRQNQVFELVKSELNNFEQSDFILFLEAYVEVMKEMRRNEIKQTYDLNDGDPSN